jgi:hypothetical protein
LLGYRKVNPVPQMSIYRKLNDRRPPSGAYANEPTKKEPVPPTSQETEFLQDYTHLRQEAQVNTPLPATLQWAASLPPRVRPTALLRQYARIANLIAANWRNPGAFDDYMESLLTNNRGKRRGFPPDIMMELLALQRWHDTLRRGTSALNVAGKRG